MATVYDYSRALAKALRESDEARRMRSIGAKVKKDSRCERLLQDFRQAQYEVQVFQVQGQPPTKELVDRLQKVAKQTEANPLLVEYLTAENEYGKVLGEVQQILAEVFNPDVPGMTK